ncbi:MAG TPA: glycosyltransferase family A protein [Opitutaceae bacterium]|nr:glycosyltransferase family A protein [Opitutaceae bacterium]HRJ45750.1 glycosyltransferase family A protein [Opitutaceae bacterium]
MSPLVSIIIPSYNSVRWLGETLESALAQTWQNREIIVIDDGSTDHSLTIAHGFESRGVRVVGQPNRGASAARNHGLRLARGDFIQYLDADDLLSPAKIERQLNLLEQRPSGTIASCAWGRFSENPAETQFVDEAVFRDFAPLDFLILAGETGTMMHPAAWLVPRAIANQAGPWDETLSLNDDGEYFCRVILASAGIVYCADADARSYYRSGLSGSLSQQRSERARRSQFHSVELIANVLRRTEDSSRTARAIAGHWRRFVHDFFPFPPDLMRRAEEEISRLGEKTGRPPMGTKTAALASLLGWRTVWRIKHHLSKE